jgi:ectoine hydroxylase-related dioxygenase (phytanoyl-CoA dioxygenase family)
MLNQQQKDHFHAFGFLFFKGLFAEDEVAGINEEADRLWADDKARADFKLSDDNSQHTTPFIEATPKLSWIAEDDRVYETATELIGPGMVWANSEGNVTGYGEARWHPDRRNMSPGELDYPRLKVMLYLDEVSADKGALRVIPGSHKNPLHDTLYPMLERQEGDRDWEPIREADDPSAMPYGVAGDQMPCHVVESKPGDVLFFNQCLWHAAYNGWEGRRYIALKLAAKPTTEQHIATLRWYSNGAFTPHETFLNSDSERLRGLVTQMAELGKA